MKYRWAVVLLSTGIAIPSMALAAEQSATDQPAQQQAAQEQTAKGDDCDRLIATLELRKSEQLPTTMEQARAYKSSNNLAACRQASAQLPAAPGQAASGKQASGEPGKIIVQQPAPQVTVQQ